MGESVLYICPSCGAYLHYDGVKNMWVCEFCDSSYSKENLEKRTEHTQQTTLSDVQGHLKAYHCANCGAEIVTDDVTAATFCIFCQSPSILPHQLEGKYEPAAIIPFATDKAQAQQAFLKLCKGKKLLPKGYTNQQHLEQITGIYVPYWIFDCKADFEYQATGENRQHWDDDDYNYTKIDKYHLHRAGMMSFENIPVDASEKMNDELMDAIEPFDFSKIQEFDLRYLTGYLAEKYSYDADELFLRMQNRVQKGIENRAEAEHPFYDSVYDVHCDTHFHSRTQRYLLLPVWLLVSTFQGNTYTFAMNGQTGKIVGQLPCDTTQSIKWFLIVFVVALTLTSVAIFVIQRYL